MPRVAWAFGGKDGVRINTQLTSLLCFSTLVFDVVFSEPSCASGNVGQDGVWIKTSETKPLLETMHYGCEHICSFELAMHSYAIFAFLVTVWRQVISMNNSHGIGSLTVTQSYIRMPQNLNWRTCTVLFVKMVELNRYELGVYQCLNPALWLETKNILK